MNEDGHNDLYAFNGIPDYYLDHPIPIQQDQLIRLYILNMTELEPALTFHIHANMFKVYRTGRTLTPNEETDVITMGLRNVTFWNSPIVLQGCICFILIKIRSRRLAVWVTLIWSVTPETVNSKR